MKDNEDIRKYFPAFHLYDSLSKAIAINDFRAFFFPPIESYFSFLYCDAFWYVFYVGNRRACNGRNNNKIFYNFHQRFMQKNHKSMVEVYTFSAINLLTITIWSRLQSFRGLIANGWFPLQVITNQPPKQSLDAKSNLTKMNH